MLPPLREMKWIFNRHLSGSSNFANFLFLIFTTTPNPLTSKMVSFIVMSPPASLEPWYCNSYMTNMCWINELWGRYYLPHIKDEEIRSEMLRHMPQSHMAGKLLVWDSGPNPPVFKTLILSIKFIIIFLEFIYLFWETECVQSGSRKGQREREREKEREGERECQAGYVLSVQSLMQASISQTLRPWPEPGAPPFH